jgi:CRISPR type III-A-associated RAMP protein Csm4
MPAFLVRLRPAGPWRIGPDSGERDRTDLIYHSDSLYSAVTSAMSRLGWMDSWLEATAHRGRGSEVRFSSAFPFLGDQLLAPPPRHLWPPPASVKIRWKAARFVPLPLISALNQGQAPDEDKWTVDGWSECVLPVIPPPPGVVAQPVIGPFRSAVRSAAAVDRLGEGVEAHRTACLEFTPGAGLWFAVEFPDEEAQGRWGDRVRAALRLLADSGFGGERSRGWGRAASPEIEEGDLAGMLGIATPEEQAGYWMLSLFLPADGEAVDWSRGAYELTTRGGRVESSAGWGVAKKDTRMISEGSVLIAPAPPAGTVRDVSPEGFAHPVYRAGFAVSIPVALDGSRRSS